MEKTIFVHFPFTNPEIVGELTLISDRSGVTDAVGENFRGVGRWSRRREHA